MTPEEIEDDWERQTFGSPLKDKKQTEKDEADYIKFLNDFITGRSTFDKVPPRKTSLPTSVTSALKTFELPITASWREVSARYRVLAKKYHPDTSASDKNIAAENFTKLSAAYDILKKHFGKK